MTYSMNITDLPDVNVLVALFKPSHQHHQIAHHWLANCTSFATTPMTESGFIRISMTRTPTDEPRSAGQAISDLVELKSDKKAEFWPDNISLTDHRSVVAHLTGPKQVTDTHLLNLAISHGGRLVTFDNKLTAALPPKYRKHILVLR